MEKRLIIVSRQLPLTMDDNGIQLCSDVLTSAIQQHFQKTRTKYSEISWAGLAGCSRNDWRSLNGHIDSDMNFIPVFVPDRSYEQFSSPIQLKSGYGETDYETFLKSIDLFCETLLKYIRPTDTVWLIDDDLSLLAKILRDHYPEITIGQHWNQTFPTYQNLNALPKKWQEEILMGLLNSDLIGFNTTGDVNNFLECILVVLGLDNERRLIHYQDRLVLTESFEPAKNEWVSDFMRSLDFIKNRQRSFQVKFLDEYTRRHLYDAFRLSKKRLILLDYDGTLVAFSSKPEMAVPGNELLDLISRLSASAANDVFLVSGRNSSFLEEHFGNLPVNLIAEHGASYKWKNRLWVKEVDTDNSWKNEAGQIMEQFVHSCPNSFIEEKEFSVAGHYRNADEELGKLKAFELASQLKTFTSDRHLQVMMGKKIVELRQSGISKGSFVRKVIEDESYDYIFAAGDDRTDEDMFKALLDKPNAFTIKVGPEASFAEYNLHTPQMVLSLLHGFDHLSSVTPA
ncbi:MAG TPA: trehalose-phosphatase [Flavisolibacter sp.]